MILLARGPVATKAEMKVTAIQRITSSHHFCSQVIKDVYTINICKIFLIGQYHQDFNSGTMISKMIIIILIMNKMFSLKSDQ